MNFLKNLRMSQRHILEMRIFFSFNGCLKMVGRLHLKRNLGILIEIEEEVNIPSNSEFKWMTMYQIKQLIKKIHGSIHMLEELFQAYEINITFVTWITF